MATLNVNGKRVTVDDSFLSLPADQQNATVDEIAATLGAPSAPQEAQQTPTPQDGSFLDPLVGQGILAGYGDEIKGAVRGGIDYLQGDGSFGDMYAQRRDAARSDYDAFSERNPGASTALEIGGAIATAPVLPQAAAFKGATMAGRAANAALTGAGYGALVGSGKGETAEERLSGGATGAALGGALGAGATPLVEGVARGVSAATRPISNTLRGVRNPDAEAARRIGESLQRDGVDPSRAAGVLDAARRSGIPMVVGDMGDDTTRALARSSANTSPEARNALQKMTSDRFESQTDRADTLVRAITGADGDTGATEEVLRRTASAFNRPRYKQAYQDGHGVWSPELEQLMQADALQQAVKRVTRTGGNRAAAGGHQPVQSPFEEVNGRFTLRKNAMSPQKIEAETAKINAEMSARRNAAQTPRERIDIDRERAQRLQALENRAQSAAAMPDAIPNLQFWDNVKRNLDDIVSEGQRKGRGNYASDVRQLRDMLRDHLDTQVPSYKAARQGAAGFFGAEDALDAGKVFFSSNMEIAAARRAAAAMNAAEKKLFARGYANDLLDKISKVADRRDITNAIFSNPKAREKAEIALGPQAAQRLEAFVRLENIMGLTKQAVQGNSTTARQLIEMGLAGGAGGAMTGDWQGMGAGALLAWGARRGGAKINDRLARRVGEMLASNDPNVLRNAAQLVAKTPNLLDAVRRAEDVIAKSLAPVSGGQSPALYGTMQSAAEDERR